MFFNSGLSECHKYLNEVYTAWGSAMAWKVEQRSSGDYAGYYRLVNQNGARNLCIDVDVDDSIDGGLEYTTTSTGAKKGIYVDTCVADSHTDAGSQSAKITRVSDGGGAWGKDTYTITFADGTGSDATQVWLALNGTMSYWAGQRLVTDDVHDSATLYLEEQVAAFDPLFLPTTGTPPTFTPPTVQIQHVTADSTACLTVPGNTVSNGKELTTAACDSTADGQKWKLERREAYPRRNYFRLVSLAGNDTHCVDNRGDFATSDRMSLWSCVGDAHSALQNQSVWLQASGDGYALIFRGTDNRLSWVTTDRADDTPAGNVGQTATTQDASAPASAIWRLTVVN